MPKAWVSGQERNEVVVGDLLNLIGVVEIYHGPLMNPDRNSERGSSCFGYATHGHGWI